MEIHHAYVTAVGDVDDALPYTSIVALNERAATLHYHGKRGREAANGAVLLIDAGASVKGYGCDITRVVVRTERYIALAPFAPRFPFETWILPMTRRAAYHSIDDEGELHELAGIVKDTLGRLNIALESPPYNLILHTAPLGEPDLPYFHWHLEIMPKLTRVAGFEIGSGFYINPTPPEDAAQYLRDVGARA